MITIIVAARNDNYGGNFRDRFFRSIEHNASRFLEVGIPFEYLLAEWNPLPDRPLLSEEFVRHIPQGRAIVIPSEIHTAYGLNAAMPFHEMAAKNAALRRARGEWIIVTNADILFGDELVRTIAERDLHSRILYRAHRVDVDPSLSLIDMQDPKNQLASGEGLYPPPYYLGAGGDFCFAEKNLWHELRGFNETIRFSTRAKDWQFFLSAVAKGVGIEFVGNVYHLDHDGGFRNTPAAELSNGSVHFGGWWDLEFGLPVTNLEDWGFGRLPSKTSPINARIEILDSRAYAIPSDRDPMERNLRDWLSRPPGTPDETSALLFYALYTAHENGRRLICRLHDIRNCIILAGLQRVAERFSIQVFCNFFWPRMPGFNTPAFRREPPQLSPGDYILEESEGSLLLREVGSCDTLDVLPRTNPVRKPEYNPLLAKRFLLACLKMRHEGIRRIALFGAGRHTEELLKWGLPDDFELVALLKSSNGIEERWGKQVLPACSIPSLSLDAILLSSSAFEPEMKVIAEQNAAIPVIPLYSDWPRDIWRLAKTAPQKRVRKRQPLRKKVRMLQLDQAL